MRYDVDVSVLNQSSSEHTHRSPAFWIAHPATLVGPSIPTGVQRLDTFLSQVYTLAGGKYEMEAPALSRIPPVSLEPKFSDPVLLERCLKGKVLKSRLAMHAIRSSRECLVALPIARRARAACSCRWRRRRWQRASPWSPRPKPSMTRSPAARTVLLARRCVACRHCFCYCCAIAFCVGERIAPPSPVLTCCR